jgi:hypothetical protein
VSGLLTNATYTSSLPANFGDLAITATTGLVTSTNATAQEVWEYVGRSLDGAQATTLITIEGAALALVDGRFMIDYANSTATQYAQDGSTRTVFDLYDRDGNLATTAESAVDRRPI